MGPLLARLGIAAGVSVLGWEIWKHERPKIQSLRHFSLSGHPIQVVVPVKSVPRKIIALKGVTDVPIPPNNGTSATYVAPPANTAQGRLGVEPTVITPFGAANLSVNSVTDIQNSLNALGANPKLNVDGISGPLTQNAIRSFQASQGIGQDGVASPQLAASLHSALANVAGTQKHVGQSIPVQAATAGLKAGVAFAGSPQGQAVIKSGLTALVSAFSSSSSSSSDDAMDVNADTPAASVTPPKDAVTRLQRILNLLGASPPLDETGTMTDETVAAVKAFQITYGLVADGIPAAKTVTAIALAVDPKAQADVLPSVAKAADHVASLAATAPATTAAPLKDAATDLATTAAQPATATDAQTHASTASAMAATAASAAPPAIAAPLAEAAHTLAASTVAPTPDPALLASAAKSIATAAAASSGPAASSLAAAADHVAAAVTATDSATAGDHLNSAAMHLSNAASPITPPAPSAGTPPAVAVSGDFGWDGTWWADHFADFWPWHQRMHPAYRAQMPRAPRGEFRRAEMAGEFGYSSGMQYSAGLGSFGWDRRGRMGEGRRHRRFEKMQQAQQGQYQGQGQYQQPSPDGDFGGHHHHRRHHRHEQEQNDQPGFGFNFHFLDPLGLFRKKHGPTAEFLDPAGIFKKHHHDPAYQVQGYAPPTPGYGRGGFHRGEGFGFHSRRGAFYGDFGHAPPPGMTQHIASSLPAQGVTRANFVPSHQATVVAVAAPVPNYHPSVYARHEAYAPPPGHPDSSAYWAARNQTLGQGGFDPRADRHWFEREGRHGNFEARRLMMDRERLAAMQQQQTAAWQPGQPNLDPNAINAYQDPNAGNPAVQDPSIDAQSNGGVSDDDSSN
jgi:peptidoglycan hydrolase-like protein with peptidoglycan-binding domain